MLSGFPFSHLNLLCEVNSMTEKLERSANKSEDPKLWDWLKGGGVGPKVHKNSK